jgi:hypothetical protein
MVEVNNTDSSGVRIDGNSGMMLVPSILMFLVLWLYVM